MSLLLDALKRAEQEKLARQGAGGGAAHPAATPTLRDTAPARSAAPAAAVPTLELQPIAGEHGANAANAPRADARTAQAVFQAKAANGNESRGRGIIWATVAAVAVVATAAGAYVWFSVRALTPQSTFTPRPRPAAAPTPAPASATPAAEQQLAAALSSPPVSPESSVPMMAPASPAPPPATPPEAAAAPRPREEAIASLLRESPATRPPEPLRLDRAALPQREVPAEIASGYEALRQGNLAAARRGYEAALAAHPANVDALLGLATVEARSGNRSAASVQYRRALEVDPRNPTALAGLASLADRARPEAVEAQVRAEIARSPESAALHFTLGNLLASQSRWNEAQAEYYEAHRLEPGSPEVLHNLAVSLDRLGQGRVAAGFYRRALEAARGQNAPFDSRAVARRLEELR